MIRERRCEFFGEEAMSYMDLKRLKLAGTLLPKIPYPYPAHSDGTFSTSNRSTYMSWNDKWYVCPIPQSEVDKDPDNLEKVNTARGY